MNAEQVPIMNADEGNLQILPPPDYSAYHEYPRAIANTSTMFADPRIRFTPSGLYLPEGMNIEEWMQVGSTLRIMERGIQFAIGDWILYGEHRYGEMYTQALDHLEGDYNTFTNYVHIARVFPVEKRREGVSWTVHREVAALPEGEREALLDRAERDGMTSREVQYEVAAIKRNNDPYSREVTPSLQGGSEMYSDYEVLQRLEKWTPEQVQTFDACLLDVWYEREGRPEDTGYDWPDYYRRRKPGDDLRAYRKAIKEIRG